MKNFTVQSQIRDRQVYFPCDGRAPMHRCAKCWTHLCTYSDGHWTAYDNGYIRQDKPYPHAQHCENFGKF